MLQNLADDARNVGEIEDRIEALFTDNGLGQAGVITLSSVHKAKGLEAKRVFILAETLKNHTREEENIRYVAITRAKQELVWVGNLAPGQVPERPDSRTRSTIARCSSTSWRPPRTYSTTRCATPKAGSSEIAKPRAPRPGVEIQRPASAVRFSGRRGVPESGLGFSGLPERPAIPNDPVGRLLAPRVQGLHKSFIKSRRSGRSAYRQAALKEFPMLNVKDTNAALDTAQKALNTQIDAAFKGRKLNVVRTLDLASKAIDRAQGHLATATEQDAKKNSTEGAAQA
jgi:hypothetical protein